MAIRRIPGHPDLTYHLIHFDKHGDELDEGNGVFGSETALTALSEPGSAITDVFLLSHGWHGDVEGAMSQYDNWVTVTAASQPEDARRPVRPLIIGVHWPSEAWGDDTIVAPSDEGLLGGEPLPGGALTVDDAVEKYADVIVDTSDARAALRTIFEASVEPEDTGKLPEAVRQAYLTLRRESRLAENGDEERASVDDWDPQEAFEHALDDTDGESGLLGGGSFLDRLRDAILAPFRQLSFWKMKARAKTFGENGAALLLRQLQDATTEDVRFHLMGHSFGSLVMSAAIAGTKNSAPVRPVHSLLLVQGAVSLWAYARAVPDERDPGYFHRIIREEMVLGPIVTTRSAFDYAVGRFYPLGAGIAGQVLLGDFPRYGGLGAFGIQGVDGAEDTEIGDDTTNYELEPGRIYNVDATTVISTLSGPGGAHNDIAHPATANIAWQAALAVP
jgi:hypothetical protein